MKTYCASPHPLTTTPFRLNLALSWLIGCALAVLVLQLTGCGEVTQSSTEDGSTQPPGNPNFRGEVPLDDTGLQGSDLTSPERSDTASDGGGESDTVVNRADGGEIGVPGDTSPPSIPVCPSTVTCDATSKACRDLCPTCTIKVDGQCYSNGFCVCRHDGGS